MKQCRLTRFIWKRTREIHARGFRDGRIAGSSYSLLDF